MPIHGIAALLEGRVNYRYAVTGVIFVVLVAMLKAWSGGRKNTWERDWAGKMILVIVSLGLGVATSSVSPPLLTLADGSAVVRDRKGRS